MSKKDKFVFSESLCLNKLSKAFHELWVSNCLTDVIFYVGKSSFRCHKVIVLAFCPVYKSKILRSHLIEILEIKLPNSTAQGLTQVLTYLYTSECHINLFNFADIIITATDLGIENLFQKCEIFINNYIKEKNMMDKCNQNDFGLIIRSINLLKPIYCKEIYQNLMKFVASNFDCLMQTDEFLDLNARIIKDFLCCYKICISTEEELLEGLLKWIRKDYANRSVYEKDLLIHVNFQYISPLNLKNFELSKNITSISSIKKKIELSHK